LVEEVEVLLASIDYKELIMGLDPVFSKDHELNLSLEMTPMGPHMTVYQGSHFEGPWYGGGGFPDADEVRIDSFFDVFAEMELPRDDSGGTIPIELVALDLKSERCISVTSFGVGNDPPEVELKAESFFDAFVEVELPGADSGRTIPIELVALNLKSDNGITVTTRDPGTNDPEEEFHIDSYFDVLIEIDLPGIGVYIFTNLFEFDWGTTYRFGDDSNGSSEDPGNQPPSNDTNKTGRNSTIRLFHSELVEPVTSPNGTPVPPIHVDVWEVEGSINFPDVTFNTSRKVTSTFNDTNKSARSKGLNNNDPPKVTVQSYGKIHLFRRGRETKPWGDHSNESFFDVTFELEGSVKGNINEGYKVSFEGSIELQNDVEKQFGDSVKVSLRSGYKLNTWVGVDDLNYTTESIINLTSRFEAKFNNTTNSSNNDLDYFRLDWVQSSEVEDMTAEGNGTYGSQVNSSINISYSSPNPYGDIELETIFEVKGLINSYSETNISESDSVVIVQNRLFTNYYNNNSAFNIDSFFDITFEINSTDDEDRVDSVASAVVALTLITEYIDDDDEDDDDDNDTIDLRTSISTSVSLNLSAGGDDDEEVDLDKLSSSVELVVSLTDNDGDRLSSNAELEVEFTTSGSGDDDDHHLVFTYNCSMIKRESDDDDELRKLFRMTSSILVGFDTEHDGPSDDDEGSNPTFNISVGVVLESGSSSSDNFAIESFFDIRIKLGSYRQANNSAYFVKLKFPWFPKGNNSETSWFRTAVFIAGSSDGTYFLPEVDDEVLVAFLEANPRAPYVIGTLWNGKDEPPSVSIDVETDDQKGNAAKYNVEKDDNICFFSSSIFETDVVFDSGDSWQLTLKDFEAGKKPGYQLEINYSPDSRSNYTAEAEYNVEVLENDTVCLTIATFKIFIYKISIDPVTGNLVKELVATQELQFVLILVKITTHVPSIPIPNFQGLQIVNLQFENIEKDYLIIKGDVK
jgi:hypothetical protein